MEKMIILHNPRCSKSREALGLLEDAKCEIEIRDYQKQPLNREELTGLLKQLGIKASQLVRKKEALFTELFPDGKASEARVLTAMLKNPILIERPIVISNGKAVIGRPPSLVLEL